MNTERIESAIKSRIFTGLSRDELVEAILLCKQRGDKVGHRVAIARHWLAYGQSFCA